MSGLTQLVGNTSGVAYVASVSSSGKLQTADSSVVSALGSTLNVADSSVVTKLGTTLNVADSSVVTALGNTLNVSAPTITTTSVEQKNAVSVSNGVTESTIALDLNGVRRMAVFGNLSDTSGSIAVMVSRDDTEYYQNEEPNIYVNSSGDYYKTIELDVRYVKFQYTNSSGVSKVLSLNTSFKK